MAIKGTINPQQGIVGKVVVRPLKQTTIASPTFHPKANVAIDEVGGVNVEVKQDFDVLMYDSTSGEYVSKQLSGAQVSVPIINGGSF